MQQEKEKTKNRPPKKGDEGPIEETGDVSGKSPEEGKDLLDKAKKAQKELEKTREKARQEDARVESDDVMVGQQHRQQSGQ